jgi:tetratricopeptide (TPR) repeat protein
MKRDDWYRNTEWNDEIEETFFSRLKRTRDKSQYLRIQACTILSTHPHVALRLLDQYFNLGEHFDLAQAYVDCADAYLAIGEVDRSIKCYESALDREKIYPQVKTNAYLDFPFVVAINNLEPYYLKCINILTENNSRLKFPIDFFLWHAAYALIHLDLGNISEAKKHSTSALEFAKKDHSGFRYHPGVGLVGDKYEDIRDKLVMLVGA